MLSILGGLGLSTLLKKLVPPSYQTSENNPDDNSHSRDDLVRLGYLGGNMTYGESDVHYIQQGWRDFADEVYVIWQREGNTLIGVWSICTTFQGFQAKETASLALKCGWKCFLGYPKNGRT